MDDFLGTLFYIILSIVILVVSALGKNKKKQEASIPYEAADSESDPFTDMPEKETEHVEGERYASEILMEMEQRKAEQKKELESSDPFSKFEKSYDIKPNEDNFFEQEGIQVDNEDERMGEATAYEYLFDEENFDARQAVLYAEIILRKEF